MAMETTQTHPNCEQATETAPPVCVSQGALRVLPDKIYSLLSSEKADKHRLHWRERKNIIILKDRIEEWNKICRPKVQPSSSEVEAAADGESWMARYWLKEVRELSYDIDDFLDELAQANTVPKSFRGNKTRRIIMLWKGRRRRRWIAYNISRFRACFEDAIAHWRTSSNLHDNDLLEPTSSQHQLPTTSSGGSPAFQRPNPNVVYGVEAPRLIGLDTRMDKVGKLLTHEAERQLKVVSIVGLGGVGKTTLAKQLYGMLGMQFHCRAFVRSSRKPEMDTLLTSILLQVRPHQPPDALESHNLVSTVRAHLQHKKYVF